MSENTEFIPAKDLPEAAGNEVSVLCLENGELKQKPGASLGGASYDVKVRIWLEFDGKTIVSKGEVLEGDYAIALEKLNNDLPAVAFVIGDGNGEEMPDNRLRYKYVVEIPLALNKPPKTAEESLIGHAFEDTFLILPDNTITVI